MAMAAKRDPKMATQKSTAANSQSKNRSALPAHTDYPSPNLMFTGSVVRTSRVWRSLIDEYLRRIGQSASRLEVMATIYYSPPETTQIQVAKRIGIEGPTLTRTLDLLEAEGLVERLPDPSDRRNKHLRLTKDGLDALNDMFLVTTKLRDRLLQGIPEKELQKANELFAMLQERLESGLPDED